MKRLYLLMTLAFCALSLPAAAQFGPFPNAGTGSGQPADLCSRFPNNTCIIAFAQDQFGTPLTQWRIDQNGTPTFTNTANTPGWIVVISSVNHQTGLQAIPGSFNGRVCQIFNPGPVGVFTGTAYGANRNFYEVVFTGSCL